MEHFLNTILSLYDLKLLSMRIPRKSKRKNEIDDKICFDSEPLTQQIFWTLSTYAEGAA